METQTNANARHTDPQLDSVDKAVELTFPASDPVALSITPSMVPAATPEPPRSVWARIRRAFRGK